MPQIGIVIAGLMVEVVFLWVALTKVRPVDAAAGGLMAIGIGVSLVVDLLQPAVSVVMGTVLGVEDFARLSMMLSAVNGLIHVGGTTMIVVAVAKLATKPGPRDA